MPDDRVIGIADSAIYPYLLAMREEVYTAHRAEERLFAARERWLRAAASSDEQDGFEASDSEQDMIAAVETLLTAHARLSLFLFPSPDRPPARARAIELRRRLAIPDDHAIGTREPRNTWMHLDEEIDRAVFDRDEKIVELYRVAREGWPSAAMAPRGVFLLLNVDSLTIEVGGKRFIIRDITSQVLEQIGAALTRVIPNVEQNLFPE